jgi:hypothetical protein
MMELTLLAAVLAAQVILSTPLLNNAVNYDEAVYLAAVDALRHGQTLGTQVFAAQFPGFYDLLTAISYVGGINLEGIRAGLLAVMAAGTIGGWLVGRRFGGPAGGLLVAGFVTIAPPLDLFAPQVIADTPAIALMLLALGLATLTGPAAAVAAGVIFAAALSLKLTALTVLPTLAWLVGRRRVLPALLGAVAVAALLGILHAQALGDLWASNVTYHDRARSTPAVIPHPHRQIIDQIPMRSPFFWLAVGAILIALGYAIGRRPLRVGPIWAWPILAFAFLLIHAPLHYNHLVLFPYALATAAGTTVGAALTRLERRQALVATAAVAVAVAAGYAQQWRRVSTAKLPEPASNIAAAHALASVTSPNARVIDDRPIISFLAHRRVVGSLVDTALLRFETGSLTDADVIAATKNADAVVLSRTLLHREHVLRYVQQHFKLRYRRGSIRIYTRQ